MSSGVGLRRARNRLKGEIEKVMLEGTSAADDSLSSNITLRNFAVLSILIADLRTNNLTRSGSSFLRVSSDGFRY